MPEGQSRKDDSFCTVTEKLTYPHHLNEDVVKNIDEEVTVFHATITRQA